MIVKRAGHAIFITGHMQDHQLFTGGNRFTCLMLLCSCMVSHLAVFQRTRGDVATPFQRCRSVGDVEAGVAAARCVLLCMYASTCM